MTEKWNPKPTIGLTDRETVKLDFDNTPFRIVKRWALRILRRFKLEGFIILKSSANCYHVVFNRRVSWEENVKIIAWACLITKHKKLTGWFIFQCVKKGSTLRISCKKGKPSPRIVDRHGKQDKEIRNFTQCRKSIKCILRKMKN
ncbi:MAG: hypothetical protein ACFFCW_36130 [Candidatus Hodarchaeota archaeon]